ncbi:DUF4920 domain-containing protein [Flavobacterium sp. LaA7.5]|nr:DUF4920 domain-containing protein [Flavobacterium salilacus subsp. altitudinum]
MKKIVLLAATLVVMIACKNNEENKSEGADTFVEAITHDEEKSYETFGDKIVAEKAFTKEEMLEKYENLKPGDTLNIKFKSTIKDVCQKKGCWMAMELPDEKESFVKFKDYGFFVPLNAAEQEAVVSGKAFVSEISVAELKHYAKDGGKSQEEIDKITEPEITYGFMADGVLIKK